MKPTSVKPAAPAKPAPPPAAPGPKPSHRTEHGFPTPDVQVFARGHDIEREAIEVVFGYWNCGIFSRHMSPGQARKLAESLIKAANHWEGTKPPAPKGDSNA